MARPDISERLKGRTGERNAAWRGGRWTNQLGYVNIRVGDRYVLEHRHVMAAVIGRPLRRDEIVHHKNQIRADNRPENLEITNRRDHIRDKHPDVFERKRVMWARGFSECVACHSTEHRHNAKGLCIRCYTAAWRESRLA